MKALSAIVVLLAAVAVAQAEEAAPSRIDSIGAGYPVSSVATFRLGAAAGSQAAMRLGSDEGQHGGLLPAFRASRCKGRRFPLSIGEFRGRLFFGYLRPHKTSDLRVSMAILARAVASASPPRTRPTRSGDNQARWIRLLT